jgi:hypothetical protein
LTERASSASTVGVAPVEADAVAAVSFPANRDANAPDAPLASGAFAAPGAPEPVDPRGVVGIVIGLMMSPPSAKDRTDVPVRDVSHSYRLAGVRT